MTRGHIRTLGRLAGAAFALFSVMAVTVLLVLPRLTGGAALTVLSGSMSPTIPVRSVVVVRPVTTSDLGPGDVITYRSSTSRALTTHRILEVQESDAGSLEFITKGDGNESVDIHPVPEQDVAGKVWFHVAYLGVVRDAVATPWGLGIIIGLAGASAAWERITTVVRRRIPMATSDPTSEAAPPAIASAAQRAPDERRKSSSLPDAVHTHATAHAAWSPDAGIQLQMNHDTIDPIPVSAVSVELQPTARVEQQLMLARLNAGMFARGKVIELLGLVGGHVVRIGTAHMVVSI